MQSENCYFQRHTENAINHIVYVGRNVDDYVCVSGKTLYKGASDQELTLPAEVTQLHCFATAGMQVMLAAGLSSLGEIVVLDSKSLTRQFSVRNSSMNSFDDFIFIDENFDDSSAK